MIIIGLTGGFGTGKTFVASILRSYGAYVIDADKIARSLFKKNTAVYRRVIKKFGEDILDTRRNIDRHLLGEIIFSDPVQRKALDRMVHPEVIRLIKREIAAHRDKKVVVLDAPLLIEAKLLYLVDMLIVVATNRKVQIERSGKERRLTRTEIVRRIQAQVPLRDKIKMADFVINNSGTKKETKMQTRNIWRKIWR